MAYDVNKAWFGIGEKTGGMFIAGGIEHTTGLIVRATNMENPIGYTLTSGRIGLGLGASGGLVGIMIFNCDNLHRLRNTDVTDWGVNISAGGRWSDLVRALRRNEQFVQLARMVWAVRRFSTNAEGIRNILHQVYTTYDFMSMGRDPKVITFDIPFAGAGAEVSVSWSSGRLSFF